MSPRCEGKLRGRMALFEEVIAAYKRAREEMTQRRRCAADHVMIELDQRLEINGRALKCFERGLALSVARMRQ
jgi:hypothetical protein